MNFTISARTEPECGNFLRIKEGTVSYTIDEFIARYGSKSGEVIDNCNIWYRGDEKSYKQIIKDYADFSSDIGFYQFQPPMLVIDPSAKASIYFIKKAADCLQFARFFTMKSALILDSNNNILWAQGYIPQFMFRCMYFGTAATWYANCFDHILQIVFWGLSLYTAVVDRDGNVYDATWDAKKTMGLCTFDFVISELKSQGLLDIKKQLTSCSGKIEEVRSWSNFIKHKGGIDYKHLEAPSPYFAVLKPVNGGAPIPVLDFKSPIEVDIDEKMSTLKQAHIDLIQCLDKAVKAVGFNT